MREMFKTNMSIRTALKTRLLNHVGFIPAYLGRLHHEVKTKKENKTDLSAIVPGDKVLIKHIPESEYKSQLLRLGLYEGQTIECISKLPGGTMVLGVNRQELALGKKLTNIIAIEKIKG
jgi:Fe2+ transport system protein FeoA